MYRNTALSIAGSDSGGGAGIQADLAAFAYFDVCGTTAVTAVTAQNPRRVTAVQPTDTDVVAAQIDAIFEAFTVGGVKTGMLFSTEIIETVAQRLTVHRPAHLVVDPVMVATSGARLLEENAVSALRQTLLPMATLITPNLPEAAMLLQRNVASGEEAAAACLELARNYECWVMVKGGHGKGTALTDYLSDGNRLVALTTPRVPAPTTHGTGCSLSAAITACLAKGMDPVKAATDAKAYVLARLRSCVEVGPATWAMHPPEELPLNAVDVQCRTVGQLEEPAS